MLSMSFQSNSQTKKEMKEATEYFEKAQKEYLDSNYQSAWWNYRIAAMVSKGKLADAHVMLSRSFIRKFENIHPATLDDYFTYSKSTKDDHVNEVSQGLRFFWESDKSKADPYLAMALVNLIWFRDDTSRYHPYYNKAISLGNYDSATLEIYHQVYYTNRLAHKKYQLKKALENDDSTTCFKMLTLLKFVEGNDDVRKLKGLVYAKFKYVQEAVATANSFAFQSPEYFDIIKELCWRWPNRETFPHEAFKNILMSAYKRGNIFSDKYRWLNNEMYTKFYNNLYELACVIDKQPVVEIPVFDSLIYLKLNELAHSKAKAGQYFSAAILYEYSYNSLWTGNTTHAGFLEYHYNRAICLALLNDSVYKKVSVNFIDYVLNEYGENSDSKPFVELKKRIKDNKPVKDLLIYNPKNKFYNEFYAIVKDNDTYNQKKVYSSSGNKEECPPVPVYDAAATIRFNKKIQNAIARWNGATKFGQEKRSSWQASNAYHDISLAYQEAISYWADINQRAVRAQRACRWNKKQYENIISLSQSYIDEANRAINAWGSSYREDFNKN